MEDITFRPARPGEAGLLSALALRSKGYWGYGVDFLDACRAELTIHPDEVTARRIVVAESAGRLLGFCSVEGRPPEADLGTLFVDPDQIGTGLGRRLWQQAVATAAAADFTTLRIEADPHAEGFYRVMGARRIGEAASGSIAGRTLPLLALDVPRGSER